MKEKIKEKVTEAKRQLIVEEVAKLFEEEGFDRLKMADIAKRLGMSVGALYNLFDSKDTLYYAYITYQIEGFYQKLLHLCEGENDPERCLQRYVEQKFSVFSAKRKAIEDPVVGDPLFFLKMNTQKSDPAQPIFDFLASLFSAVEKRIPLKEKDPLKTAYLFNAYTTGYIEYWIHYETALDDEPEKVVAIFLHGMAE